MLKPLNSAPTGQHNTTPWSKHMAVGDVYAIYAMMLETVRVMGKTDSKCCCYMRLVSTRESGIENTCR